MSRQQNPIDDLFHDALSGVRREPSRGVWSSIESRFFGSAGRMRFILYLSMILILISSGLALYFRLDYNPGSVLAGSGPDNIQDKPALTSLIAEENLSENDRTSSSTQNEAPDTSHSI